jgi:hypothetical protein
VTRQQIVTRDLRTRPPGHPRHIATKTRLLNLSPAVIAHQHGCGIGVEAASIGCAGAASFQNETTSSN